MFRLFRHYIPKTLLMLGAAEALILLVSIYIGVTLKLMGASFKSFKSFRYFLIWAASSELSPFSKIAAE